MGSLALICALASGQGRPPSPAPPAASAAASAVALSAAIGVDGQRAPDGCTPRWEWYTRKDGVTGWTWGWKVGDRFYYYPQNQPPGTPPERPSAPVLSGVPGSPIPAAPPRGKDGLVNYGVELAKDRGVGPRLDTNDPGFGAKLFDVVPPMTTAAHAAPGQEVPLPERRSKAPAHDEVVRYLIPAGIVLVAIAILVSGKRGQ